jgi:hypothetical protein
MCWVQVPSVRSSGPITHKHSSSALAGLLPNFVVMQDSASGSKIPVGIAHASALCTSRENSGTLFQAPPCSQRSGDTVCDREHTVFAGFFGADIFPMF